MRKTSDLIAVLADSATPVRRLRPPSVRAGIWLALAAALLGLLCLAHGVRPDLAGRLQQPVFVVGMIGTLSTAALAALAAFKLGVPGSSRRWLLLPLPALAVWVSTIGYGCLTDWVSMSADGVRMGEAVRCFATLLLNSIPISLAMLVMLRHAAPLRPMAVSAAGGLAIAAMTSFALALLHDLDATIMILIWNLGMAALIAGLASAFGLTALDWVSARIMPALPSQLARRR
ncbi:NrsF family protein [Bradyrhizobium betae]|uniref:NrsF family protein n=1 Tax=Bradyrhizobium betae TaxID=244734 RepID=UPI003D67C92E